MQIVSLHEMSGSIFWEQKITYVIKKEKTNKKKKQVKLLNFFTQYAKC